MALDRFNQDALTHVVPPDPMPWARPPQPTVAGVLANPWARVQPPRAVTTNAVAGANDARSNVVTPGGDYEGAAQKQRAERGVGSMGALPTLNGSLGGVADNGANFTLTPTGRGNIDRIDEQGKSPLFTNMGLAGRDDLAKMRAPLPSVESALRNVPNMPSVINPQRQSAPAQPSVTSIGGAPTFIPGDGSTGPTILGGGGDRVSALDEQIDKYQKSGSMFDSWRARQLEKRRDRMVANDTLRANVGVNALNAQTAQQKLDVDANSALLTARAHMYGADQTRAAHEATVQGDLLKNAGPMWRDAQLRKLVESGRYKDAMDFMRLQHPPAPQYPKQLVPTGMPGQAMYIDENNVPQFVNAAELAAQAEAAKRNAQREAAAGAK